MIEIVMIIHTKPDIIIGFLTLCSLLSTNNATTVKLNIIWLISIPSETKDIIFNITIPITLKHDALEIQNTLTVSSYNTSTGS